MIIIINDNNYYKNDNDLDVGRRRLAQREVPRHEDVGPRQPQAVPRAGGLPAGGLDGRPRLQERRLDAALSHLFC